MSDTTFESSRERILSRLDALESEWETLHAASIRDGMGEIQAEQMRLHVELRELHRAEDKRWDGEIIAIFPEISV